MARKTLEKAAAALDPNAPRYGAPTPAPKIGEAVLYIRPEPPPPEEIGTDGKGGKRVIAPEPFVKVVGARIEFVHPQTELEGRVVNLEFSTAKGTEKALNVPFYPREVMEEDGDVLIGNTWHREVLPDATPTTERTKTT